MSAPLRLGLFALLVAAALGAAALAGAATDPDVGDGEDDHRPERGTTMDDHRGTHRSSASAPTGLASAGAGLRLALEQTEVPRGRPARLRFRILDRDGEPVRDFDVAHERRMHAIVVRRDLTGYRHLHPRPAADGAWEVPLHLDAAGSYRVFADFERRGEGHTLGADLSVAGDYRPRALPHPADAASAGDGYEARLAEGEDGSLRFTVFRDGERVDDVEPYLGARGHLVALREGDLAFLHVHPESAATEGGDVRFRVEYPSAGRYRLFLQFKHDGRVRTAALTRETGDVHGH